MNMDDFGGVTYGLLQESRQKHRPFLKVSALLLYFPVSWLFIYILCILYIYIYIHIYFHSVNEKSIFYSLQYGYLSIVITQFKLTSYIYIYICCILSYMISIVIYLFNIDIYSYLSYYYMVIYISILIYVITMFF